MQNSEGASAPEEEMIESDIVVPKLTADGIEWCAANSTSLVARVAVIGDSMGMSAASRRLAVQIANDKGLLVVLGGPGA